MKLPKLFPEACIIILALLVRLIHLDSSFWLDEAAQALESSRPLSEQLQIANDFQPPLFHLIVHAFMQLGQSEAWLRLASLLPGLVTVGLTMAIGTRLFSRDVGLTAGILLATSQYHLFYSQELRPYSLAACLALAAFWGWLDLVRSDRRFSPLFLLSSLAGIYTTYLFPVFLLSLLMITFCWYRPKFLKLSCYFLFLSLGFLPWLPSFLGQIRVGTTLAAASPTWSTIVSPPLLKMLPLVYLKFMFGRLPFDPNLTTVLATVLVLVSLITLVNRLKDHPSGQLVIGLALLPVAVAFIVSVFVPVLDPKRVLFCLPFFYLVVAAGINQRGSGAAILLLFLTLNLSAIRQYAVVPDYQREPWRQAIATLEANSPADTLALFAFEAPFAPWVWYQTADFATLSLTDPTALPGVTNSRIALFDYLRPMYDPADRLAAGLVSQGFKETGFYQYPGIGKIRLYAR